MLNALGAAALGVLIFAPHAIFGASFQLTFLSVLIIAAIGMPVVLAYSACIYWIFRGKVKLTESSY